MKLMNTVDAVGQVLCHDITQIIKDEVKGPVFRKGHIIREEDIPVLLSVGKDTIYIWENDESMLHENDAAEVLRDICQNENMHATEPKEGKIELIADADGLFLVDLDRLRAINALGDMMIATRSSGFMVKKGDKLCGTRVIPLVIAGAIEAPEGTDLLWTSFLLTCMACGIYAIISVVLYVAAGFLQNKSGVVLEWVYAIVIAAAELMQLLVMTSTINGLAELSYQCRRDDLVARGNTIIKIIGTVYTLNISMIIAGRVFKLFMKESILDTITMIVTAIILILTVIAYILYLGYLGKVSSMLRRN